MTDFKFSNDPDRGRELEVFRSSYKFISNLTRFCKILDDQVARFVESCDLYIHLRFRMIIKARVTLIGLEYQSLNLISGRRAFRGVGSMAKFLPIKISDKCLICFQSFLTT